MANHKAKTQAAIPAEALDRFAVEMATKSAEAPLPPAPQLEVPTQPDLTAATLHGRDAFLAIMEAAQLEADMLRKSSVNAIAVAEQFKVDMYAMVDKMCQPVLVASMEYQQLVDSTADNILREARRMGDVALGFTSRLKGMSDSVREHAKGNGNGNDNRTDMGVSGDSGSNSRVDDGNK